jgi:hypothetical protein
MQHVKTSREGYKGQHTLWKKGYKVVVDDIRSIKEQLKAKGQLGHNSSVTIAELQSKLQTRKAQARAMMLGLIVMRAERQARAIVEQDEFLRLKQISARRERLEATRQQRIKQGLPVKTRQLSEETLNRLAEQKLYSQ